MTAAAAHARTKTPLKARDAVWTVTVIDPLAVPLVARVARRRSVTPNRLTVASALVAILAGVAFALGELVVGALVYQLSFLLDCMDGKLAKARSLSNPLGGWFDVIGDTIRLIACAIGLVIALQDEAALAVPLTMAYVSLRFGVLAIAEARELPARAHSIDVAPRPLAVLRAAPRRSGPPGTTVDIEAIAFTVGPLVGLPVVGVALAALAELAHLAMYVLQAVRAGRSGARRPPR
jgi:phosphatidylglycerophosphate synthase